MFEQEIVDLIESDSSLDDLEENEDYEDAPESFQVDDDIFVDHVVPPKTQNLSKFLNLLLFFIYGLFLVIELVSG